MLNSLDTLSNTRGMLVLSMCHLQAYPSRMQTLFSWRKDNFTKDVFPDNNLGQESSIAVLSVLCWEIRPAILHGSFLDISKQNSNYTYQLFFESTQGCDKTVTALNRLRTPQSISAILCQHWKAQWSLLFVTPSFVSWAYYLDGHPSKGMGKNWSLITKTSWPQWNRKLNTWPSLLI